MPWKSNVKARTRALGLTLTLALLTAGCNQTAGGGTNTGAAICRQFRPVAWSQRDTPETVDQVKANNAVGASVCGWRPPA